MDICDNSENELSGYSNSKDKSIHLMKDYLENKIN